MSQPPDKYDRIFDFTDFSAMQPSAQQPGQKIDQELNAARVSINETIDRLNEIQRDDGKLRATAVDTSEFQGIVDAATATATAAATSAATSATTATTKAGEATASATTASNAATTATGASASAQAQATIASTSATTATTKATEASNSATAALASQTSATASAATATTKAAEASGSAATAATQASNAQNSANTSSAQANLATAAAVAAGNSASTASAQAIAASNSASAASASAASAAASASSINPAYVLKANNLSDLTNASTARNNLSLGPTNTVAFRTVNLSEGAVEAADTLSTLSIATGAGGYALTASTESFVEGDTSPIVSESGTLNLNKSGFYLYRYPTYNTSNPSNPTSGGEMNYVASTGVLTIRAYDTGAATDDTITVEPTGVTFADTTKQVTAFLPADYYTASYIETTFAPLASPTFTGTPSLPTGTTAVTQSAGNNTTALATTAFVQQEVPAASTTAAGKVELATNAEAVAGTSTTLAVTPNGLEAEIVSPTVSKYFSPAWVGGSIGTGSSALNVFGNQRVIAPTSAVGVALRNHPISQNVRGANPDNGAVNFSKRIVWGFRLIRYAFGTTDVNSVCRVVLGKTGAVGTPTTRSIGIYFTGTSVLSLMVHDGTTLRFVDTTFTPVHLQGFDAVIISDGTGNVSLFVNGTLAATSANGPVGNSASTPDHRIEVENIAVLTGSPMGAYYSNHTISTEA